MNLLSDLNLRETGGIKKLEPLKSIEYRLII